VALTGIVVTCAVEFTWKYNSNHVSGYESLWNVGHTRFILFNTKNNGTSFISDVGNNYA